jgi:membrane-bound inhibitor of C-type lysozyme
MRRLSVVTMVAATLAVGACQRSSEPETPAVAAAPAASAPAGAVVMPSHSYQCGDLAVTATFDGVGAVDLSYAGGPLTLPQVESASGVRYADQQGNEFWSEGEQATFTFAGKEKRNCVPASPGS